MGRHKWAELRAMWNMSREGLRQIYEQLPGHKPPFDEVWKWTGGNTWALALLYEEEWDAEKAAKKLAVERRLTALIRSLNDAEREALKKALEDPDAVLKGKIEKALIELNLIAEVWNREEWLWIDQPPPERDPELGIGRHYAWQTPLHREAVRIALRQK